MVNSLNDKDLPEPQFEKKGKAGPAPKQTRAASKKLAEEQTQEDDIVQEPSSRGRGCEKAMSKEPKDVEVEEPSTRGRVRDKGKSKEPAPAKGKKKREISLLRNRPRGVRPH